MKNFKIEVKWAFVFSISSLFWVVLEKLLGWHDVAIEKELFGTYFFAIPFVLIYLLAIRDKKINFFNKTMTWQQGMVTGVYLSFFIALLSPVVQLLSYKFVSPEFFQNMIAYVVLHKKMTDVAAAAYFCLNSYIKQGVFSSLSIGVVLSAIVAYFLQSKPIKK